MGGFEESLMKRFRDLEASQAKLREQLGMVLRGRTILSSSMEEEFEEGGIIPGYFVRSPYESLLEHIGHALYIHHPITGEIFYWNHAAENLYGWKDYEVLGQNIATLLVEDESYPFLEKVMERLKGGQKWSGQFPFRKKSERVFMAMLTQSVLYDNDKLIGIITVSTDNSILYDMKEKPKNSNEPSGEKTGRKINYGRANLRPQQDFTSSVSNLASNFLPRIGYGSDEGENSRERCGCTLETENKHWEKPKIPAWKTTFRLRPGLRSIETKTYKYEETISEFNPQSRTASKVLSKLNIRGNAWNHEEFNEGIQSSSAQTSDDGFQKKHSLDLSLKVHGHAEESSSFPSKRIEDSAADLANIPKKVAIDESIDSSTKCVQCSSRTELSNIKTKNITSCEQSEKDDVLIKATVLPKQKSLQKQGENCSSTGSAETNSSSQNDPSSLDKEDLKLVTDCDIRWEDLLIGEEVGQGSFAVVYHGVWNGSDVAVKVYIGNDYQECLLLEYKKEISIMKRLRHPNVLLFMGAVYSPARLAIVTEFLPRGSLFKALHKNNQKLDMKRRLKMALDVARGMNYLHRRNPPIIHRDLKSSNLLVDKNWTVKVGDFGLSRLKISTVLTATSARGTPQWMAPEVLRGECSSEKSDVFSFGVILWELMTESVPWSQLSPLQVIGIVGFMDRRLDLPENIDPQACSVICDCWESDPERRPSFQELVGRVGGLINAVALRDRSVTVGNEI